MTKPEKIVQQILESLGFQVKEYKHKSSLDPSGMFYSQTPFDNMRLDFALPHAKLAIEVNGDYWHGGRSTKINSIQLQTKLRDADKKHKLHTKGWKLINIQESDLKDRRRTSEIVLKQILSLLDL